MQFFKKRIEGQNTTLEMRGAIKCLPEKIKNTQSGIPAISCLSMANKLFLLEKIIVKQACKVTDNPRFFQGSALPDNFDSKRF